MNNTQRKVLCGTLILFAWISNTWVGDWSLSMDITSWFATSRRRYSHDLFVAGPTWPSRTPIGSVAASSYRSDYSAESPSSGPVGATKLIQIGRSDRTWHDINRNGAPQTQAAFELAR